MATEDTEMTAPAHRELRMEHLNFLISRGINPYQTTFKPTLSLTEFIEKYDYIEPGEHLDFAEHDVSVAGRVYLK
jgi:lysyl-tRNA synthetase class II